MSASTRRHVLRAGAAAAVAAPAAAYAAGPAQAGPRAAAARAAAARTPEAPHAGAAFGPVTVRPDDPRYASLRLRGYNHRHASRPDRIRLVGTTADVVRAVDDAVRDGRRVAVRSGGHCFEDFVDHPGTEVIIDMSGMRAAGFDRRRRAFFVEAGATLGEAYRRLFLGWGVTVPGGTCTGVGAGGHVAGGGYGALCRLYGLTVDHLYAVEVVVVDGSSRARSVVATREASDPHRDLWWAHTGGGGGSFGVVTRYWFRSPAAALGADPGALLPRPPATVLRYSLGWRWADLDEDGFVTLMRNYGRWAERNSAPGSPAAALYGEFAMSASPAGTLGIAGQVAADDATARRLLDDLERALTRGRGVPRPEREATTMPWLAATLHTGGADAGPFTSRMKIKSGYRRRGYSAAQLTTLYRALTDPAYDNPFGTVFINTYGGQVNAVAPGATAMPHRDSVFLVGFLTGWMDEGEDERQLKWTRELYDKVYADSGGVPAGRDDSGTFINYPDNDLADPGHNSSGTPWHRLYFGDAGYARLRRAKERWDPLNVFHHGLSVRPPA
ncbi:FAD-binding protein [Streptomyces sp. WMMC500]|uniref:FAD-binding oxidoreductase n=1 Tax=Streptomyces sp. WMMC500 TaxID=3015154 RepID=UPI00248C8D36|nr:FAD-binding protein [Streptomyces sp. WMMC500]WBB57788.1 FAD-binding protein [Streptomyces sp. WMMC500]